MLAPHAMPCRPVYVRAFTIVELLVVVVIMGILAAIIIPVMGAARKSGQSTRCQTNLRQIALAVTMYGTDHKNDLVPMYYPKEVPSDPFSTANWTALLAPYLGRSESGAFSSYDEMPVYSCPSRPGTWGYGYNYNWLSPWVGGAAPGQPSVSIVKRGDVANPSKTVMFVDSYVPEGSNWRVFVRYPGFSAAHWSATSPDPYTIDFCHPGQTANVAWVDGHVSAEKPNTAFTQDDSLWDLK